MKRISEYIRNIPEEIALSKREFLLTVAVGVLAGTVFGMLISPRKNSCFGCNNGTTITSEDEE